MKARLLLITCLALMCSAPVWAAADHANCEARSQQLHGSEKESFLSTCLSQTLAQTSTPERVHALTAQEKRNTCEQNAKNKKIEGAQKANYINDCVNANDAAVEARKAGVKEHVASAQPARTHVATAPKATEPAKPATKHTEKSAAPAKASLKTCTKQANQEKLKGQARKRYIRDCRKAG